MSQRGDRILQAAAGGNVTKESIRQKVWKYLEDNNLACFPRPVFHRIPNFKDAEKASSKVAQLDEFKKARTVKVNPDKPQEGVRFHALEARKILLVPTPRLRSGLLNRIEPPSYNKEMLRICSTRKGIDEYSTSMGLETKVKVDVIITGCVAVSRKGQRIGKGEGFADLEYGMMSSLGIVDEHVPVITTVHDSQVFDELPDELFGEHDLTVDIIVTPNEIIRCEPRLPKPKGIRWSLLTPERLNEMPILKSLRKKQQDEGVNVDLKAEGLRSVGSSSHDSGKSKGQQMDEKSATLYVANIPHDSNLSELKDALFFANVKPVRIYWKTNYAFLKFPSVTEADDALKKLRDLSLRDQMLKVNFSRK